MLWFILTWVLKWKRACVQLSLLLGLPFRQYSTTRILVTKCSLLECSWHGYWWFVGFVSVLQPIFWWNLRNDQNDGHTHFQYCQEQQKHKKPSFLDLHNSCSKGVAMEIGSAYAYYPFLLSKHLTVLCIISNSVIFPCIYGHT